MEFEERWETVAADTDDEEEQQEEQEEEQDDGEEPEEDPAVEAVPDRALLPRDIGHSGMWTLSSCKSGFGLTQLRDPNTSLYWQ